MKDYRPDGCKMYVAIDDLEFQPVKLGQDGIHISKGEVWMLKQITSDGRVCLNKQYEDEEILQISQELLEIDFVEIDMKYINKNTTYIFSEDKCTEIVTVNGYEISKETYIKTSIV